MGEPIWTQEQIDALNAFQRAGQYHPFTCPGKPAPGCAVRELIATPYGWVCACGEYRQDWAHSFMMFPYPHRSPAMSGAGLTEARGIACSWCGKRIRPNAARMRLHESESIRASGKWLAHFHPECGDDLLDACEARTAGRAALSQATGGGG